MLAALHSLKQRPMKPGEFQAKYPLILNWIQQTLAKHTAKARPVMSLGFKRLTPYFTQARLATAKVVVVEVVPVPPLTAIGLRQFADFERMSASAITYLDTFCKIEYDETLNRGREGYQVREASAFDQPAGRVLNIGATSPRLRLQMFTNPYDHWASSCKSPSAMSIACKSNRALACISLAGGWGGRISVKRP